MTADDPLRAAAEAVFSAECCCKACRCSAHNRLRAALAADTAPLDNDCICGDTEHKGNCHFGWHNNECRMKE